MRRLTRSMLVAIIIASGFTGVAIGPEGGGARPAGAQQSCEQPAEATEGFWIANPGSAVREQWLAAANGLLADGTNDEAQFNRASLLAACASVTNRKVNIAYGHYHFDYHGTGRMEWTGDPNGPYPGYGWQEAMVAWEPAGGPSASSPVVFHAPNPWTVIHAPIRSAVVANRPCGFTQRLVSILENRNIWLDGFVIDGHSAQQVTPSSTSRQDVRWQTEGIREQGAPNFRATNLTINNIRGTTGGGGCGETNSMTLWQGRASNITVQNTDGGDQATGFAQMLRAGSQITNSKVLGNMAIDHGFAQWYATNAVRSNNEVRDVRSSGFRSERSTGSVDSDLTSWNANDGMVFNCTHNHSATRIRAYPNRRWGVAIVRAANITMTDSQAFYSSDGDVLVYVTSTPECGATNYPNSGNFNGLAFNTRNWGHRVQSPGQEPNWASLGLNRGTLIY